MKFHWKSAGGILLLAVCLSIGGTSAYFTDRDEALNQCKPGHQTSTIEEEFPETTPVPPNESPTFEKNVTVQNSSEEGNVSCYVRARILYSNSDIGNLVVLHNLNLTNWIQKSDGYYYYKSRLDPGASTTPLFTSFTLDSRKATEESFFYAKDFKITIYEESIQAENYPDYQTAWNAFLRAESV